MRVLITLLLAALLQACASAPAPRPATAPTPAAAAAAAAPVQAAVAVAPPATAAGPVAPEPMPAAEPAAAMAATPAPVTRPVAEAPSAASPAAVPQPRAPAQPIAPTPTPKPAATPAATPVAAAAAAVPAIGSTLSGRVELGTSGGNTFEARELSETVVYFVPDSGGRRPQPGRFRMYTQGKAFDPPLLIVPIGSSVSFPNNDPIRHNVYSGTPGAAFDLGFYGEGESREHVFDQPGLVVVNCNVHHVMQAQVLVLPTAYHTRVDASGKFRLDELPAGRGVLHFWHPRANPSSLPVSVPTGTSIDRTLVISKARVGR